MKTAGKIGLLIWLLFFSKHTFAQSDSLGLPGDNLDLEAVLSIFKNSSNVEDFEKKLNSASEKVNNLDLNNDGQVDYLRVIESGKDDFRSVVIQDPISKSESQDVAVIEIEKRDNQTAHVQIVGDETLYGKDYIIEPADQKAAARETKTDNSNSDDAYSSGSGGGTQTRNTTHVTVNVWAWPAVTYMYAPGYSYWVSPWYWGYYPGWYSPWTPFGYYHYRRAWVGYSYGFYGYRTHVYAFPHGHHYYYGRRVSSGYVQKTAPGYANRSRVYNNGNRVDQRRGTPSNVNRGHNNNRINTNRREGVQGQQRTGSQPRMENRQRQGDRVRSNSGRSENRTQTAPQQRQQQVPQQRQQTERRSPGTERQHAQPQGGQRGNMGGGGTRQGGGGGGGGSRQGGGGGGGHRR